MTVVAVAVAIEVFVADEQSERPVDVARWAALARSVLSAQGVSEAAEMSLLFVGEDAITHLNKKFLGKNGPTDVLAFPMDEDPTQPGRSPDSGGSGPGSTPAEAEEMPNLVGDVVICPEVAWNNAVVRDGSYEDEVALLLVHGVLHLMGMDHLDSDEATVMEAREQELLDRLYRRPDTTGSDPTNEADRGGTA